jgi:hypothetical protein
VHLQADAVAEAVVEAVLEYLAVALVQSGRIALLVEALAGQDVDVAARDARLDRRERPLEDLVDELVVRASSSGGSPTTKVRVMSA